MSHPVIDRGQEAAILHEMLFEDECGGDHSAIAPVDPVTEPLDALSDTEHVVTDRPVTKVADVPLGFVHPLMQIEERFGHATEATC